MPAESTYVPLAIQTLGADAGSVTFSSISSIYTDLVIMFTARCTSTQTLYIRFNGDSATNYSSTNVRQASSTASSRQTSIDRGLLGIVSVGLSSTENVFTEIHINNYSNASTFKVLSSRSSLTSSETDANITLWRNTSPITSITILPSAGNFITGSKFTLFGIKAA